MTTSKPANVEQKHSKLCNCASCQNERGLITAIRGAALTALIGAMIIGFVIWVMS